MSVTDPVVARRERRRRFEGRPAALLTAIGASALAVACAAALGIMIGDLAEDMRHSVIDSVFDDRESGPTFWGLGTPALVVVGALVRNRRLRAQRMLRTRLLTDGRRAPGTMTHVAPRTTTNDVGQRTVIGATVDVRFTDDDGVERRVSRFTTERNLTPGPGGAEVLYDPLDPAEERSIFVAFVRDPLPSEWVGCAD